MKIKEIYLSSQFKKSIKKYPHLKKEIKDKIEVFQTDYTNPKLKTHKLTGKLEEYYAFSINYHIRIVFEFLSKDTVAFIDIGTHEIYK